MKAIVFDITLWSEQENLVDKFEKKWKNGLVIGEFKDKDGNIAQLSRVDLVRVSYDEEMVLVYSSSAAIDVTAHFKKVVNVIKKDIKKCLGKGATEKDIPDITEFKMEIYENN